jgi:chromosomal replication initiator protein
MLDVSRIWTEASGTLKTSLGDTVFETWITPLKPKSQSGLQFVIEAPDGFFKEWVERHYRQVIQESVRKATGEMTELLVEALAKPVAGSQKPAMDIARLRAAESRDNLSLNPRYTFDNFVLGPSNRHAHAYSAAVADSPGKTYNPLFIYGGVGLGKSHLMQAICHHVRGAFPQLKICYMPSEKFTNELIDAIQHKSTGAFRQKFRNVDLLVLDDIHFIAGKESTQEEFFHTFNALYDNHKQIIISSDRTPKEIANLQERLVSRFSWGLTTDVQPPDLETRVAILKKKIEREPVHIPDEVIFFIAQLIKTNIRELEGALVRIIAYSLMEEELITVDLAKEVLKDLLKEPKKLITVDFIQRCVAEEFGISLADMKLRRRNKTIVLPRQVAMYLSRELTDQSFPEIGEHFGGKDHTTVLHSYNKIKEEILGDNGLKEKINRITQVINQ